MIEPCFGYNTLVKELLDGVTGGYFGKIDGKLPLLMNLPCFDH